MEYSQKLKEKILSAPDSSGVYLISDAAGCVLYVGKAKVLKKRLLSYLRAKLSSKTSALMHRAHDVQVRLTPSEDMALLLEASLIRELKPKYNVSLRDDKSFPYVRISREDFPAIHITRKKDTLPAQYLGPYTNTKLLKNALKIIRRNFAYRTCRRMPKQYPTLPDRPVRASAQACIYYKINLCPAPCIGRISHQEYSQVINNIVLILEGKVDLLVRGLTKLMQEKSLARDFEAAARVRDQITVLSAMAAGSTGVNHQGELEDLKNKLELSHKPERIEGFDISNISGDHAVGSMVSFHNGSPDKNNYRRFRIKSFQGINDYKMLAEVLRRRYLRLIKEGGALPDLLLIDGGKGHLFTAAKQLETLHLNIPLVSIAKPRKITSANGLRGKKEEHIYCSQKSRPLDFSEGAPALNLIRRVRDEAHRFALAYHHVLRRKALLMAQ